MVVHTPTGRDGVLVAELLGAQGYVVRRSASAAELGEQLDEATLGLLTRATRGSAFSKGLGKRAFYAQVDLDQPKAYAHAMSVMASSSQSHDAQEGMSSFLEHRPARFENR